METDGTPTQPLLSYHTWLQLPAEVRQKLTQLFTIPRTGEVVVRVGAMINDNIGGETQSDGHAPQDFYTITTEKMQVALGSDSTDFNALFNGCVQAIADGAEVMGGRLMVVHDVSEELATEVIPEEVVEETIEEAKPAKHAKAKAEN